MDGEGAGRRRTPAGGLEGLYTPSPTDDPWAADSAPNKESTMFRSAGRSNPRWLDAIPVRASAIDARGPALRGPTAMGALAVGATALGAVAIGRLAIGRAAIKRLVIEDLEVRRLRVVDLEVVSERRPQPTAASEPPEAAS